MKEKKSVSSVFSSQSLGPTPTSSERRTYFGVRNVLALISRCMHFDTSKRVEKEERRMQGETKRKKREIDEV